MRKNGAMFICNRCRKQTFAERFDDGVFSKDALQGWALDHKDVWVLVICARNVSKNIVM